MDVGRLIRRNEPVRVAGCADSTTGEASRGNGIGEGKVKGGEDEE